MQIPRKILVPGKQLCKVFVDLCHLADVSKNNLLPNLVVFAAMNFNVSLFSQRLLSMLWLKVSEV